VCVLIDLTFTFIGNDNRIPLQNIVLRFTGNHRVWDQLLFNQV